MPSMDCTIRDARDDEGDVIGALIRDAFGDEGEEIAVLVTRLCDDPTAVPRLSRVAMNGARVVGHILMTRVWIEGATDDLRASILAPLAVHPDCQGAGVGGMLIRDALERLRADGCALVFVLGYPAYYQRHGFAAAGAAGFDAPYPIAPENAEAWMVLALEDGVIGRVRGRVQCASALDEARYWRE